MKIALLSDLHVDHYSSKVHGLIDHFKSLGLGEYPVADVCVLAGDIADGRFPDQYYELFKGLRNWFTRILVVTGNHDYYRSTLEKTHHSIERAIKNLDDEFDGKCGVHFLNNSSIAIGGRTFHGGTMWYRDQPGNEMYEHWMNDIHYIEGFKSWVYQQNMLFEHHLNGKCVEGDIIISHHMPSFRSVAARYKRQETNRFFVCDMEHFIKMRQPALWLHGHTHDSFDYPIDGIDDEWKTRVVCNPRGYPRERTHGTRGYEPLIIEV